MAISINGSTNVISGVAVGGLPDGIVDADMLASSAVTSGKLATGVGGKILQVIEASSSTTVTATSGSSDLLTVSITPSSASNKVLVSVNVQLFITAGSSNAFSSAKIYRGTSSGTQIALSLGGQNEATACYTSLTNQVLDSPNTTSAQTYTATIGRYSSGTTNVSTDGNEYNMIAMEVAA